MGSLKILLLSAACIIPHLVFSVNQTAQRPSSPTCAVSGVPGVPGVPGVNGRDGAKGDGGPIGAPGKKGPKGSSGTKGDQGPIGAPGKKGPKGSSGTKGDQGPIGAPGKKGPKGSSGTKGDQGPVGPPGKTGAKGSQGNKGEKGPTGMIPQRNWKQCAWKALQDNKDSGLIKDCVFIKKEDKTALKVEFDGDFRLGYCLRCCKRWYFIFNGVECSKPVTIEAIDVIYYNHGKTNTNIHKHSQIGGYCEGIGKGTVRVGLMVGDCGHGYKSGSDAYTGYISTSRIVIEEVPPPQ